MKPPPYGRQWLDNPPAAGVVVAIGPEAWDVAANRPFTVMVLPDDRLPVEFQWPSNGQPALIFETGEPDDVRIESLARVLMLAGAPSIVVLRYAWLNGDPRIFFSQEVADVAA